MAPVDAWNPDDAERLSDTWTGNTLLYPGFNLHVIRFARFNKVSESSLTYINAVHATYLPTRRIITMEAGPSRLADGTLSRPRKPRAPHPARPQQPTTVHRRPPLPARPRPESAPTLPLKPLQGCATRRTDTTRPGFGREYIFVTRKTSLGALMGRARNLVVDEG